MLTGPALKIEQLNRIYPTVVWENEESTKLSRLYHGGVGLQAKLNAVKTELRRRMHEPIPEHTGARVRA